MGWPDPRLAPSALVIMLGQNVGRPKQGSKSTETGPNLERDLSTAGYSRGEGRSEGQKICYRGWGEVFTAEGSSENIWKVE
jgi:hypothetical protein